MTAWIWRGCSLVVPEYCKIAHLTPMSKLGEWERQGVDSYGLISPTSVGNVFRSIIEELIVTHLENWVLIKQ